MIIATGDKMRATEKTDVIAINQTQPVVDMGDIADEIQLSTGIANNLLCIALSANVGLTREAEVLIRAALRYVDDIEKISLRLFNANSKGKGGER